MKKLTDFTSYADAQANFASAKLWELFDGDRERLNIAHECIDRHVDGEKTAVIVVKASGGEEILSYRRISEDSSRFAYWLVAKGVVPGDRVAIKLEPSRAFYAAVFGAKLKSFDAAKVASMRGVKKVAAVADNAVAVVADTWWNAKTALEALPGQAVDPIGTMLRIRPGAEATLLR